MKYSSAVPVLSLWEEFSLTHPNGTVQVFARWILKEKQATPARVQPGKNRFPAKSKATSEMTAESKAMLLIYRLHRFIQLRSKPVIKKIGFAKPQEFGVLAEIYLLEQPNKKEVAKKMLLEISTAVEITKRLVQRGFIKEVWDPNDKRATRLTITEKGVRKLQESYDGLKSVHSNFLDCLDDREKSELLRLLEELEKFQLAFMNGRS